MSWFQTEPTMSWELTGLLGVDPAAAVIDVGGGASPFVDRLVAAGYDDVTVLDVSDAALRAAERRVGTAAGVTWLHADLLEWRPERRYDLWHDRAVFHFLTDPAERTAYRERLDEGTAAGAAVIVATFAEDGPEQCSGLPVARYSAEGLAAALGDRFRVVAERRELHRTPAGGVQPFTWIAARAG